MGVRPQLPTTGEEWPRDLGRGRDPKGNYMETQVGPELQPLIRSCVFSGP